jgi:hypothetical protein
VILPYSVVVGVRERMDLAILVPEGRSLFRAVSIVFVVDWRDGIL